MRHYDDDSTEETPAQVYLQLQRERAAQRNFVTPAPLATRQPQTIDAPAWLATSQPLDVAQAWQAQQGPKETTSAVDRAKGLQMRLAPFVALYALAGVVVGGAVWLVAGIMPIATLLAVLTFVALGIFTYRRMNLDDYDHSGAGVERLRITEAADLQREQMAHEQELKRLAFEAYLRRLERD